MKRIHMLLIHTLEMMVVEGILLHLRNGEGRKIVYIAPMKALAQEVVEKFSSKLKPLNVIVRELTGDMQLTRLEAESSDIIVTTPEKWDVVTRKGGDGLLRRTRGLLSIDEVHLN
mmetsp:Transcript_48291/g.73017  ORF Transcript_48291/g.73017 Transcript_48291/m.73017 type:complete len:115 (-) Transcript_48291:72-416(-)